jgi:hypothetical protein
MGPRLFHRKGRCMGCLTLIVSLLVLWKRDTLDSREEGRVNDLRLFFVMFTNLVTPFLHEMSESSLKTPGSADITGVA